MTNNKRFVDNGCESVEDSGFEDTLTGKNYYVDYFDEIVDLVNELSKENEKHIERYYQLIEHIQKLQKIIRENKAEKERQLEMKLQECENFRHYILKEMEKIIEERKNDDGFQVWEIPPISFTTNNNGDDE